MQKTKQKGQIWTQTKNNTRKSSHFNNLTGAY
jgi:hypothetical protein